MRIIFLKTIAGMLAFILAIIPVQAADVPQKNKVQTDNPRDIAFVNALKGVLPCTLDLIDSPGLNIAVARGGKVIFEGAYGYADVFKKKPMKLDTVFHSGSMGKVYTGIAIMQLVERGVISLDDPINKYLPFKVQNPLGGEEIKVYHLMTHSSGLMGDGAGSTFSEPLPLAESLKAKYATDQQPLMGGVPTWSYKTGEKRSYSNIGIATLGLIVERANPEQLSFSDFVEKNIMQPLGMTSTQYPPAQSKKHVRPDIWKRMSKGYNSSGDIYIETPRVYFGEFPAGGFVSIPRDHVRLFMALMNNGELDGVRILKAETVKQMLTVSGPSSHPGYPDLQHGLVWFLEDWAVAGKKAFHHGGGHMFGWRTMGIAWPDHDTAVVYAFNEWSAVKNKAYYPLINGIVRTLLEAELPVRAKPDLFDIKNLAWKASYLRGLLFVEGYRLSIGVPEELDIAVAKRIAKEAQAIPYSDGNSLPWDKEGFLAGVADMNTVELNREAITAFTNSDDMKISLEEAKRIWPWIGSKSAFANLAGTLTAK